MSRIEQTAEAQNDLLEIWLYIAEQNTEAADNLLDLINSKILTLVSSPLMGRERPELAPEVRSIPVGKYIVFYRLIDDGIEILRVLHGSRDLPTLFDS